MGGGEILRKGWLVKSPPLDSGGIKNWRKRFFRLRSSKILEYFKSEDGDLKGVINLEDCKAVNSDLFHKKYKYVFDIETHDRVYYLVATSAQEMTAWVDALCKVCGFIQQSAQAPVAELPQSTKTMGNIKGTKEEAVISAPMVATLPHNLSGSRLTDNSKPEEQVDIYSLATATIYDVQGQLGRSVEVPAGTPLTDALSAKGMAASPYNPLYGQAAKLPNNAYFSPRSQPDDVSALYASPQKKTKNKVPKQQSLDGMAAPEPSPKHCPLVGTVSDAGPRVHSENQRPNIPSSASVSTGYKPAETMSNGYMRPAQWIGQGRPPNYDYVTGPPRPADPPSTQHRSALLKKEDSQPSGMDSKDTHTYINMKELHKELGQIDTSPQVDRSNKPRNASPPRVDRRLKPGSIGGHSEEDSPHGSPPNFPTRTGSVSTPPILDASDLPKPTKKTMQYTQLQFNAESGQMSIVNEPPVDVTKRAPIPTPRGMSKAKRVNYSDIDISATAEMAAKQERQMSLSEAEMAALAEKPYVNVARDGHPDDDTDPDYYTHMRNLPQDSLLYVLMTKKGDDETEENIYQEPRETMSP